MISKIRSLTLLSLLFITGISQLTAAANPEIRGVWVDTWGAGFRSKAEIDQLVSDAQRANLNMILPQVRRRGDVFYNSSIEPKAAQVSPSSFDPLAYLIQKAHAANPPIEVHAWVIAYPIGSSHSSPNHILNKNPDWVTESSGGSKIVSNEYWLDPSHPEVQQHILDLSLELVTKYNIDGLHFDRIRYPSPDWGYHPIAVARFNEQHGRTGKPASSDAAWRQFRRDSVTQLIRRIYLEAINLKPAIKISAATIGQGGGPSSPAQWPNSAAYASDLQDWRSWMEEGILDLNMPMLYYDAQGQWVHGWNNWNRFAKDHKYGRHLAIGPAWYLNTVADSLTQINQVRQPTPSGNHAEGMSGYDYRTTNTQGISRTSFFNTLANGPFSEKATIPPMPWKTNPTRGHAMGIINTDDTNSPFSNATITFTGPENRTVYSDPNGFYGAANLKPGTYSVTASAPKTAYDPVTLSITVTNGSVTTQNITLEFTPAAEIILDDPDADFTGSWGPGTNPAQYGTGYRTAYPSSGSPTATATYRPTISIPGTYEIHVWYVHGSNRCPDVPYTIAHSGGQKTIRIDQRTGGGQWRLLDSGIHFSAGNDGFVRISNNASSGAIMADAVRFSLIEADPDPDDFFLNPLVHAGSGQAIATWETVEPARVKVEYGTSQLSTVTTPETTANAAEHSVTLSGLDSSSTYHYRLHARAGSRSFTSNWGTFDTSAPAEIIVDNTDSSVTFTGNWTTGTSPASQYGSNYHLSYASARGATATFRPNLPVAGTYDVYTWYVSGGNRATTVSYTIQHAEGQTTVIVNQTVNGASWQPLVSGKQFNKGTDSFVKITNNESGSGVTMADAQRWVLRDSTPNHSLTTHTDGSGSISQTPSGSSLPHGTTVTLTATPGNGSVFSHWEGDYEGTQNTISFPLYRDRSVTAVFQPLFELTAGVSGEGTVEITPSETHFPADSEVEVLAIPAPGWTFLHWDGHEPGDENPALVWMDSDKSLTANFGFSYDAWAENIFNNSQLADPNFSGPFSDPLGHGIPNLLKYAFGLDPENPDFTKLPQISTESGKLIIRFQRLIRPAGIGYIIESSSDLSSWSPAFDQFTETGTTPNPDGRTEQVTLESNSNLTEAEPRIFIRLQIAEQ